MKSSVPAGLHALHRLVGDVRRRVVQQRNQQPPEARVGDLADGDGDVAARASRPRRRVSLMSRAAPLRPGRRRRRWRCAASATAAVARMRGSGSARSGRASVAASSLVDRRERADGRGADAGVARRRACGGCAAATARRCRCARRRAPASARRAHLRRLVIEQQRRDQVALVERLEHVDRVDHARRVRVRQFLHQRFDRREVGAAQPQLVGLHDRARLDALAERVRYPRLARERHEVSTSASHRRLAKLSCCHVEAEAPRLNQHEHQQRRRAPWRSDRP